MELLDHNSFIERLTSLFESASDRGSSIWLTHKRLIHDGEDVAMGEVNDTREYPCLVRARKGAIKFSTHVTSSELDKFHALYGALLKSRMTTLRKRDKKREKQRAEEAALRRKKVLDAVVVDGPKRGNGRKKRQRQVMALRKQGEAQRRAKEREEKAASAKNAAGAGASS